MRNIGIEDLKKVSGGAKDFDDFYQEIVKPGIYMGAGAVAGIGGGFGSYIVVYGIEGFIDAAPGAMDALQQINALSDDDIADRFNNPYRYE